LKHVGEYNKCIKIKNLCIKLVKKDLSNKLLVGGICCDLEKVPDCFDQENLLSKLKFHGFSGKDLALYHSYLDNRHFRTAIYNNSDKSNKVLSWAKVRYGVPHGSVLGPLLFLL